MNSQPLEVGIEPARDLQRPYGRFDRGDSRLALSRSGGIVALVELALNVTERSMQPIDAAHVQPSVDAWRKPMSGIITASTG